MPHLHPLLLAIILSPVDIYRFGEMASCEVIYPQTASITYTGHGVDIICLEFEFAHI